MFYPALEDGKNCLVFANQSELLAVLNKAMAMSDAEAVPIAQGAIDYYEQHLAAPSCINNLLEHRRRRISLRLLPFLKTGGGFA
jgi:hypothetical protein